MGNDQLVLSDPRLFDQVLQREGKYPIGAGEDVTTFTKFYEENNLQVALKGASRGEDWKEWRSTLDTDMYREWQSYLPTIADAAAKISAVAGREANNIGFESFLSRAAFDMFTAVMVGESPGTTDSTVASPEDVEFVKATQAAFDVTGRLLSNPLDQIFGGDLYQEFNVNMDKTYKFANQRNKKAADQAVKLQQSTAAEGVTAESESKCPLKGLKDSINSKFITPSFVERLVHRGQLSNDDIAEIAAPLLMAGVDTTAYVMSWLHLNLASNPHAQSKLAAELKEVLNGADLTTKEQMDALPYLKACIRESHRLTPATVVVTKTLEEDIDIVDGTNSYHVPAGKRILLNNRGIPMDPKYVSNPTLYEPERFLPDAIAARKGTPAQIIDHPSFAEPFGRGKRRCLGANVANAEIMILAARLFQDWEIGLKDGTAEWKASQKLMLKADPYPNMTVIPRV
jgi:cytochrome P450